MVVGYTERKNLWSIIVILYKLKSVCVFILWNLKKFII